VMIFRDAINDFRVGIGQSIGMFLARERENDAGIIAAHGRQLISPAVMNSGLAQRLVKCRYWVQRLLRLSLAHVLLQDNGELQPRRLTGNVYL
jgi:hypothetical protein